MNELEKKIDCILSNFYSKSIFNAVKFDKKPDRQLYSDKIFLEIGKYLEFGSNYDKAELTEAIENAEKRNEKRKEDMKNEM